jgi:hypothetical protein
MLDIAQKQYRMSRTFPRGFPGRLLPQNKMLPERIVGEGAFGKRVEDSIKFILHSLS